VQTPTSQHAALGRLQAARIWKGPIRMTRSVSPTLRKALVASVLISVCLAGFLALNGARSAAAVQMPILSANGKNIISVVNRQLPIDLQGRVQLNVFGGVSASPQNLAWSYGSCTTCDTVSLALQVNVVGNSTVVHARNLAVAQNFKCPGCKTVAVALQYIIVVQTQNIAAAVPPDAIGLVNRMNQEFKAMAADPNITPAEAIARTNGVLYQFSSLLHYLLTQIVQTTQTTTPGASAAPSVP
jgi:hypothetical protein